MNSFTFPLQIQDRVVSAILNKIRETKNPILSELYKNHSYEGGFNLPLNDAYLATNPDIVHNKYIKYHNARQLRFIRNNGNIIGLKLKDNIPYWSDIELKELEKLIHEYLQCNNENIHKLDESIHENLY